MKRDGRRLKLSKDAVASYLRYFLPIVGRLHAFPTRLKIILGWARTVWWERVWCKPAYPEPLGVPFRHIDLHPVRLGQTTDHDKRIMTPLILPPPCLPPPLPLATGVNKAVYHLSNSRLIFWSFQLKMEQVSYHHHHHSSSSSSSSYILIR